MYYKNIEIIPSILKGSRPSQFEGESFTALEYVSKISVKINECVEEYNKFLDGVIKEITEYKDSEFKNRELFEMTMEQKFYDFRKVIELKYKSQDLVISRAVEYMKTNLTASVEEVLSTILESGDLDENILQAVGNLKAEFQETVEYVNDEIATFRAEIEEFTTNTNNTVNTFTTEMTTDWTTTKTAMVTATNNANVATQDCYDAISALNIAVVNIDGGTPATTNYTDEFDGGSPS